MPVKRSPLFLFDMLLTNRIPSVRLGVEFPQCTDTYGPAPHLIAQYKSLMFPGSLLVVSFVTT